MPNKIVNLFIHFFLTTLLLFCSVLYLMAEEPKDVAKTTVQIYYSGAQSGYIEPCG